MKGTATVALLTTLALPLAAQEQRPPEGWRWVTDAPARTVAGNQVPDSAWRFVNMPPGWHVTTGPGVVVFHPRYRAEGRFALEAEIFLFPGTSQNEYGIFVGAAGLDGDGPRYAAFVVRRDGGVRVSLPGQPAAPPAEPHEAVARPDADGMAKNTLRVEAAADSVTFLVNGTVVQRRSRTEVSADGAFGLRVGPDLNLHISRLDFTQHLAPARVGR